MKLQSTTNKAISALGMLAVGDALGFAVAPKPHVRVWSFATAPRWYRRIGKAALKSRRWSLSAAAIELALGAGLLALADRRARRLA